MAGATDNAFRAGDLGELFAQRGIVITAGMLDARVIALVFNRYEQGLGDPCHIQASG